MSQLPVQPDWPTSEKPPSRPLRRAGAGAGADTDNASRRRETLSAAKRTTAGGGYHATTIADESKAAGLSYDSIHWYHESKETLFRQDMTAEATALRSHIEIAAGGSPEGAGRAGPLIFELLLNGLLPRTGSGSGETISGAR